MKMLSYFLAIGNVLNGGTNKGQADGFELTVLGRVHTFRNNHGMSILQYVCLKMKQTDEAFPEKIEAIAKSVQVRSTDTGILKRIADEVQSKAS